MKDVTQLEEPKYPLKDYGIDLLIAGIPTGIIVAFLNTVGVSGAIIPLISLIFFMYISKKIRKNKNWSRSKVLGVALLAYLLVFIGLPMLLIPFL